MKPHLAGIHIGEEILADQGGPERADGSAVGAGEFLPRPVGERAAAGVAVEAVTAGIPLIYTRDTWCEDLAADVGAGGVSVNDTTLGTLVANLGYDALKFPNPVGLAGGFEYNVDLFDESTVERMLAHLTLLLVGIADVARIYTEHLAVVQADQHLDHESLLRVT